MTCVFENVCVFLRKGGTARRIVFTGNLNDWRRHGRPGYSKNGRKETLSEFSVFSGRTKNTSGYHFDYFGVHFGAFFLDNYYEDCFFFKAFASLSILSCFLRGAGGGGVTHLA